MMAVSSNVMWCAVLLAALSALVCGENWTVESGNFVVEVTGNENVPKYTFYLMTNETDKSKVSFDKMYEAEMKDGKLKKSGGGTNVALPSLNWNFTRPTTGGEECVTIVHNTTVCSDCNLHPAPNVNATMNMTTSNDTSLPASCDACVAAQNSTDEVCFCVSEEITAEEGDEGSWTTTCNCTINVYSACNETTFNITNVNEPDDKKTWWEKLNFVNRLLDTEGNSHIKVDIEINQYQWQKNESEYLVIEMSADLGEGVEMTDDESFYRIGDAYISSEQFAVLQPSNETIRVTLHVGSIDEDDETATKAGSKSISLVYDRWPEGEDMYHDPSFGFVTSTDDPFAADEGGSSSSSGFWTTTNIIIISIVGSIALLAVVAAIVGGAIFMVHRRRAAYESV